MDTLEPTSKSKAMPPKLDAKSQTVRLHIVVPQALLDDIAEWRASERPIPGHSQSIRKLLELGLKAARELKK